MQNKQYAENTYTNTANDGVYVSNNEEVDETKTNTPSEISNEVENKNRIYKNNFEPGSPELIFNGEYLYWIENGKIIEQWSAISGKPNKQAKNNTNLSGEGPIPEGDWVLPIDELQNYWQTDQSLLKYVGNIFGKGEWPGSIPAWGTNRGWLFPLEGTDTQGRTNLSIHGGWEASSAGCIDLTSNMNKLAEKIRNYGKDIKLKVIYVKDRW